MVVCRNSVFFVAVTSVGIALAMPQLVSAQQGRGGAMFGAARVQLATLPEVVAELKLTDEQKKNAVEISDKLREDRRELFQSGAGDDFAALQEKLQKLSSEATEKFVVTLDAAQRKRLTELFVQANGTRALNDAEVSKALEITEEQGRKLSELRQESSQAVRDAFQDLQGASQEERREALGKLRDEWDKKFLAVLTDAQRQQLDQMKGKVIELDLSPLAPRRQAN